MILIDEAPQAAQDLFGRGSWRSGRDAPCQKGPVRLVKDDRVHGTSLVALKLHPEIFQLFDRESAVPVGDEKICRLARRRQCDLPVGIERNDVLDRTVLVGPDASFPERSIEYVAARDASKHNVG